MFAKLLVYGAVLIGLVAGRAGAQYHHASTAYEGALRGEADFMRSAGQAYYWASVADLQYAEATRQWQIAEQERILFRQESRANAKHWRNSRISRLTHEQSNDIAQNSAVKPLTERQLDRATGQLRWPKVLLQDRYARIRTRLEVLVEKRCVSLETDTTQLDDEIDKLASELLEAVKSDVHRIRSGSDFMSAKNFVEGLLREFESTNV